MEAERAAGKALSSARATVRAVSYLAGYVVGLAERLGHIDPKEAAAIKHDINALLALDEGSGMGDTREGNDLAP